MALSLDGDRARLSHTVTAEEAEPLLAWLQAHPDGAVDLAGVTHLHTAVLQLLLMAAPPVARGFDDPFLACWVHWSPTREPDALETAV